MNSDIHCSFLVPSSRTQAWRSLTDISSIRHDHSTRGFSRLNCPTVHRSQERFDSLRQQQQRFFVNSQAHLQEFSLSK